MANRNFGNLLEAVSAQAAKAPQDDTTRKTSLAGLNLPSSVTSGATNRLDGTSQVVRISSTGTDTGLSGSDQNITDFTAPNTANKVPRVYGYVNLGGTIVDTYKEDANTVWVCTVLSEFDLDRFDDNGTADCAIRTVSRNGEVLCDRTTPSGGKYVTGDGFTHGNAGLLNLNTNTIYSWGSNSASNPLNYWVYAGSSDSANLIAQTGGSGNAYDFFPTWTSANTMDNLLFAIIKVQFYEDEPNDFKIDKFGSWRFEVMLRQGATNSMPVGSGGANVTPNFKNPAHILYDYLTSDRYGVGLDAADIDVDSIYDWYTECNTTITLDDEYDDFVINPRLSGSDYDRFGECGYVVNPQLPVIENIKAICQAGMATLSYNYKTGKFGVNMTRAFTGFGGSYEGYDRFDFNKNNVLGEIAINTTDLYSLFNFNECTFPNYAGRYQTDTVIVTTPVDDKVPNEVTSGMSISIPAVTWRPQAADIANITLKQSRVDQVATLTADHSSLIVDVGDFVTLTDESKGIDGDVYRVKRIQENNQTAAVTVNFILEKCLTTPFTEVVYENTVNDPFATGVGFDSNFGPGGSQDFTDPVLEYQTVLSNVIVLYDPINGNGDGNIINPATGSITGVWDPFTPNSPPGGFNGISITEDPWIAIKTDYDSLTDPIEINKIVITAELTGSSGNPVAEVTTWTQTGAGGFHDSDTWDTLRGDKFTTGTYRFTSHFFSEQKHEASLNVPITLPTKPTLISSVTGPISVDMTQRCLGNTMLNTYGTKTQIVQTVSNQSLPGVGFTNLITPLQHDIIGAAIGEYEVKCNITPTWSSTTSTATLGLGVQGNVTFANTANNESELFEFNCGGLSLSGNANVMSESNIESNVQTFTGSFNTDPEYYGLDPDSYYASRCNVVVRGYALNISSPQATDIDYSITNKTPYWRMYS